MKQYSLKVQSRESFGRRKSNALRADGMVPAIIYGKNDPRGLMIDSKNFVKLHKQVAGITALVELEDEKGKKSLSFIREVQRNRLTDAYNHIDFIEVNPNEQMRALVRIRTVGESVGVKMENAILEVVYPQVAVKCLPKDLPEVLEVDVSGLHAGDAIFVKQLKAPAGVSFAEKADQVVITCNVPEVEEEKAPEAGAVAADGTAAPAADGAAAAPAADGKAAAPAAGKDAKAAAPAKDAKAAAPAKAPAKK
jgi:large subunit ribosomal protein L25